MSRPFAEQDAPWDRGDEAVFENEGLEACLLSALHRDVTDAAAVDPIWFMLPLHAEMARGIAALVERGDTVIEAESLFAAIGRKGKDRLDGLVLDGRPVATLGDFARLLRNKAGLMPPARRLMADVQANWLRREIKRWAAADLNGGSPSKGLSVLFGKLEELRASVLTPAVSFEVGAAMFATLRAPNYLFDGLLQRNFFYALTARTGDGKTAIALRLARCLCAGEGFGPHRCKPGRVLYFAGENPDDVKYRLKAMHALEPFDIERFVIYPATAHLRDIGPAAARIAEQHGGFDLVVIDTSAAHFFGDEENSNSQMGTHARTMRKLCALPGNPTVLVLCHPAKAAKEAHQLEPRGGGAFMAELDGNLTAWKHDGTLIDVYQNKLRGPDFAPLTLRLETLKTTELVDAEGRMMPTVTARAVDEDIVEEGLREAAREHDRCTLVGLLDKLSLTEIARRNQWYIGGDPTQPMKQRAARCAERMARKEKPPLTRQDAHGAWGLTDRGVEAATKFREEATVRRFQD